MADARTSVAAMFASLQAASSACDVFDRPRAPASVLRAHEAAIAAEDAAAQLVLSGAAESLEEAIMQVVVIARYIAVMDASEPSAKWEDDITVMAQAMASAMLCFDRHGLLPAGVVPADILGTGHAEAVASVRTVACPRAGDALVSSR